MAESGNGDPGTDMDPDAPTTRRALNARRRGTTAFAVLDERGILPNAPTGLIQRIGIIAGWGWIVLLALYVLRLMTGKSEEVQ